jgi:hypothetical protein
MEAGRILQKNKKWKNKTIRFSSYFFQYGLAAVHPKGLPFVDKKFAMAFCRMTFCPLKKLLSF